MFLGISERLQYKLPSRTYIPSQSYLELCEIKKYVEGKN